MSVCHACDRDFTLLDQHEGECIKKLRYELVSQREKTHGAWIRITRLEEYLSIAAQLLQDMVDCADKRKTFIKNAVDMIQEPRPDDK